MSKAGWDVPPGADPAYFYWEPAPSPAGGAGISGESVQELDGRAPSDHSFWTFATVAIVGAALLAAAVCLVASASKILAPSMYADPAETGELTAPAYGSRRSLLRHQRREPRQWPHTKDRVLRVPLPSKRPQKHPRATSSPPATLREEIFPVSQIGATPPSGGACGPAFYAYCPVPRQEYRARGRTCVPSTADRVAVCNRGPNRFASLEECYRACGLLQGPARDDCFEQTLFTACQRQDLVRSWWHFNGRRCAEWSFPQGDCPVNGTDVYDSLQECRAKCEAGDDGRRPRCQPPASTTCQVDLLRFPYFARILPSGRGHCMKAAVNTLLIHRCLIGANRFGTKAACVDACFHRPH